MPFRRPVQTRSPRAEMTRSAVRPDELYSPLNYLARPFVIVLDVEAVMARGVVDHLERHVIRQRGPDETVETRVQLRVVKPGPGDEHRRGAFYAPLPGGPPGKT